jgi:hypothetical protein
MPHDVVLHMLAQEYLSAIVSASDGSAGIHADWPG